MNTDFKRKRVLVVDDEPNVREAIATIMEFFGMEVVEASNGAEALDHCRAARFDYVLTDHNMPGMCGDELSRLIKELSPDQRIVMVTGHAGGAMMNGRLPVAVDALVEKPCGIDQLARALRGGAEPIQSPSAAL